MGEDFATSRDVIEKTSSLQLLMDGSGLVQESRWHPPTPLLQVGAISHGHLQDTRPNLKTTMCLSLTMLNLISMGVEACMGVLNDIYDDGIKWHDIACYHTKPFICEDSDQLLEYVQALQPEFEP